MPNWIKWTALFFILSTWFIVVSIHQRVKPEPVWEIIWQGDLETDWYDTSQQFTIIRHGDREEDLSIENHYIGSLKLSASGS